MPMVAMHEKTPEEVYSGYKPDVSHFKVYGCICYVHIPDKKRKLDPKVDKYMIVGYAIEHKGTGAIT